MTANKRILAAFVLVFLCLNAGGTLCLTYCGLADHPALAAENAKPAVSHCPMHRDAAAEDNGQPRMVSMAPACCSVPLGIIPAPSESRYQAPVPALIPAPASMPAQPVLIADALSAEPLPVYRPPPIDSRIDRLLNCVIRI